MFGVLEFGDPKHVKVNNYRLRKWKYNRAQGSAGYCRGIWKKLSSFWNVGVHWI